MSRELKQLGGADLPKEDLPLGYAKIFTSDAILDEETTKRATLALARYRHAVLYVRRAGKPISKVEL